MRTFLIFGRPRSRTAWTANFLTHANSFCFHEGLADCDGSFIRLKERMEEMRRPPIDEHQFRYAAVGNADTGMIHELDAALEAFPNARLVLLTENETSWRMFAEKKQIPKEIVERIDYDYWRAKQVLPERGALVMPVADLTAETDRWACKLWGHCIGHHQHYDPARHRMLRDLNVQVVPESLERRLNLPHR